MYINSAQVALNSVATIVVGPHGNLCVTKLSIIITQLNLEGLCVTILLDRSTISINWSHVSHFYAHFCILYFGLNYHTDHAN